jgi:hypothetical protein
MDRTALVKLVEQIRQSAPGRRLIVFGSSSLLASFPDSTPAELGVELTLDGDFFIDPDDENSRAQLLATFGNARAYHDANGFYADFVDLRASSSFPSGWQTRLRPFPDLPDVFALDPVDVATNKMFATGQARVHKRMGRRPEDRGDKDINTVSALLAAGLVDADSVHQRLMSLDIDNAFLVEALKALNTASVRAATHPRSQDLSR